jgi:TRAP-type C4-dicarboxylate transport system permease small subunit
VSSSEEQPGERSEDERTGAREADGVSDPLANWFDRAGELLDRWSDRASYELFRVGIFGALPVLVVLVSVDIILRYAFNAPLQWARDVNGLLLLTATFCTLPHTWDRAYHIRMEIFYVRVRAERRRWLDVLASLAGIVFFGFMAVQAFLYLPFMIRTNETGEDLLLPIWPFMVVLGVCALVTVARLFANPAGTDDRIRHRLPAHSDAGAEP